jgi:hypothetical protein
VTVTTLDPRIDAIRERYGLSRDDFWELPQRKGTWLVKHAALEIVAVKADIVFDPPQIIEAHSEAGIAVVAVAGSMYERREPDVKTEVRREWSIGEASPKNNKNAYPWAMAEKRAKDRVILKLIGIHGLVYSEDEMAGGVEDAPPKQLVKVSREAEKQMREEVDACATVEDLEILWRSKLFQAEFEKLHPTYKDGIIELMRERKAWLAGNPARTPVAPNFDNMERASQ